MEAEAAERELTQLRSEADTGRNLLAVSERRIEELRQQCVQKKQTTLSPSFSLSLSFCLSASLSFSFSLSFFSISLKGMS